jgi:acyl carrier protein
VEPVGIHDPFLELGGHSLLATQIIARLINVFRLDVPTRVLMQASTVAELSSLIVAHESIPGQAAKIARVWQEVKKMSEEEVREALR